MNTVFPVSKYDDELTEYTYKDIKVQASSKVQKMP